MNIIETIQKNLGFNALEKIDPNTQETPGAENPMGNNALSQAGIPAILLGIYNKLEQDPKSELISGESLPAGTLMERIFGKSVDTVIGRIYQYIQNADKNSVQELNHIASESLRVIREKIGDTNNEDSVRKFVAANKPDTLLYLPPALDLGTVLNNNNLDDRTGKMEGPISSFMRKIEKSFNTSAGS